MDFRKLGNILMALGLVAIAGAALWWFNFFSSVVREARRLPGLFENPSVFDLKSCLYSSGDICGIAAAGARALGYTPYEPMVLWAGLAAFVIGLVVRAAAKPAVAR